MPRAPRIQTPDLVRHVMSRGNGKMPIFLDDSDYRHFIYLLSEVVLEFELHCWNYCLMPNHYHLTIQPARPNLSEAIRRLNGNYGLWWNKRHERVGHVFQGRFKDQIVDKDGYLLSLTRYVVMNPVRAGLVRRPEEWLWSSYRATIAAGPVPPFLDTMATLRLFGDENDEALRSRFSGFIGSQPDDASLVDRFRSSERVLGSRAFKEQLTSVETLRRFEVEVV